MAQRLDFQVKTLTGRTLEFPDLPLGTTCGQLKRLIQHSQGTPPSQQRLVVAGKQVGDADLLLELHDTLAYLVLRLHCICCGIYNLPKLEFRREASTGRRIMSEIGDGRLSFEGNETRIALNEKTTLLVQVVEGYPFEAPRIAVISNPPLVHPNIMHGKLIGIPKSTWAWSPAKTITTLVELVAGILDTPCEPKEGGQSFSWKEETYASADRNAFRLLQRVVSSGGWSPASHCIFPFEDRKTVFALLCVLRKRVDLKKLPNDLLYHLIRFIVRESVDELVSIASFVYK